MGWGHGRNQPCQVSCKSIHRFWLPVGSKFAVFLYLALWLIQQVGLPPRQDGLVMVGPRGSAVERQSLESVILTSHARPVADG